MEELEKLEYPKPNRDFIYDTFNDFSAKHPWVGQENIRPKSIARAMYENFQSFAEYVRDLELQRVEGLLLRYLSDVYKTLAQAVPDLAKDDELRLMTTYFATMVKQIDSSLVEEWEKLRNPKWVSEEITGQAHPRAEARELDITQDTRGFGILVRNEIFRVLRALSGKDIQAALEIVSSDLTAEQIEKALATYHTDHLRILTDPRARNVANTREASVTPEQKEIHQIIVDPDGHNDWEAQFQLDLKRSAQESRAVLKLLSLGPIS